MSRLCLFAIIFFLIFTEETKAQNLGAVDLEDSIYSVLESDYESAKKLLVKYEDQIIPQDVVFFLDDILARGDTNFYKDRMTYLMINYGWNYNNIEKHSLSALTSELSKNNMHKWTFRASQKHFPVWLKNNMESILIQEKVQAILHTDQSIRGLLFSIDDSTELNVIYRMITEIDFNNLIEICELSDENNEVLLNDFDNGIAIYNNVQLVLWHNLKSKENFQKSWDLILPYIEKAYFQKKIDSDPFKMYDIWSLNHKGYQYFGTLKDTIPVFDSLVLSNMRTKYQF